MQLLDESLRDSVNSATGHFPSLPFFSSLDVNSSSSSKKWISENSLEEICFSSCKWLHLLGLLFIPSEHSTLGGLQLLAENLSHFLHSPCWVIQQHTELRDSSGWRVFFPCWLPNESALSFFCLFGTSRWSCAVLILVLHFPHHQCDDFQTWFAPRFLGKVQSNNCSSAIWKEMDTFLQGWIKLRSLLRGVPKIVSTAPLLRAIFLTPDPWVFRFLSLYCVPLFFKNYLWQ